MRLLDKTARELIDLNPKGSIDKEIAERQFQVILKGFNYLYQEGSDFLYIADEVGLGKTYVALGIASLLRHFSTLERRNSYKDVILVPKQNLQHKWVREINNFIRHNYLKECNIVKSVLGAPVGECSERSIHNRLTYFHDNTPSYEIFRISSLSIATTQYSDWKTRLLESLPITVHDFFKKGIKLYRKKSDEIYLKRLFAYLLNLTLPEIDLLIVDEAHNFKHGIGSEVAIRNQVISRMMGVVQEEEDQQLFVDFPELKDQIIRKARKVIFLSATPIDNGLYELKNQFDCFIPNHAYRNLEDVEAELKTALSSFMIRGLMKIQIDQEGTVSRNMYRHEHRKGNVVKLPDAAPQKIESNLESIIIGLLQLKTLKHFNESNNKSFEIGMLAGFETFNTQSESDREYEDSSVHENKSADSEIIKNMAESYFNHFDTYLPHPKQDNLVEVLFDGMKKGEKALVFVRRIASVMELERKLINKLEKWDYERIKKYLSKSSRLKILETAYQERHQIMEIDRLLYEVSKKVYELYKWDLRELSEDDSIDLVQRSYDILLELFNSSLDYDEFKRFRNQIKGHVGLRNIKTELKKLAFELIRKYLTDRGKQEIENDYEQIEEQDDALFGYFFSSYFSTKRYQEGFNFRNRSSTKDWFRFNLYYLRDEINELDFDENKLRNIEFSEKEKTEARRIELANDRLMEAIAKDGRPMKKTFQEIDPFFLRKPFLNYLFQEELHKEFKFWLDEHWNSNSAIHDFWENLEALIEIIRGIFRNGSGLLPSYIAECIYPENYEKGLLKILKETFPEVLNELKVIICDFDKIIATNFPDKSKIQRALYNQTPVVGASGSHKRNISRVAMQFRMPGFPYVLITTDVLKEGEDLHLYCSDVYHYGIAWNPSDMEQRTGRIDRINSMSYFKLKKDGKRTFDNSLQVFYPYLADTLEVNQVAKVFTKMNAFIDTFYDLSNVIEKDTKATTDAIIEIIPEQIKDLLESKYDYENFQGISDQIIDELEPNYGIGFTKQSLLEKLQTTFDLIIQKFNDFYVFPKQDPINFSISANVKLNGRRAPLKIIMLKGKSFDEILWSVESIICRSTELRSRTIRDEIKNSLQELGFDLIDNNESLLVEKRIDLDTPNQEMFETIKRVIQTADKLEERYTGGDLDI
ncbi:hypothetical protein E4S40_02330 [Algoriphagus kandeliae]|uniref:DEAD/DEAH box helicase n=1 Tax=Algoriphagus kandeliae TaxID=2562278 RepID=A0A4Y9R1S8_9BACT|nr:helicase-related protein [Algoriphagus kandeliae]TFV97513.1 hypothetical protein E4S40_02330 [Algoriphagus kandeliae]